MRKHLKLCLLLSLFLAIFSFGFADTYQIGNGTTTQYNVPCYGYYNYSSSKAIYTAAEIAAAGLVSPEGLIAIGYDITNTPNNYLMENQYVYMRHTEQTVYEDANMISSADFTLVYSGDVVFNDGGWFYLTLDTPFPYDGSSGIEILWENRNGDWNSGYPIYRSTTLSNMAAYLYQDGSFPEAPITGTWATSRPNITLVSPQTTPPNAAALVAPVNGGIVLGENVTLSWSDGGGFPTGYKLYAGTSNPPAFIADVGNVTSHQLTGLLDDVTYYWKVEPYNDSGDQLSVPVWSFDANPAGLVTIGDGTYGQRNPFGHLYGYERSAALYTFDDIGTVGMIERICWDCSAVGSVPVPYKIYLGTTTETEIPALTFANMIENMTLVHEGIYSFLSTGWQAFNLASPFAYVGGNLIVVVETNYGGGGGSSTESFRYTSGETNKHIYWYADHNPPTTTGIRTANRPNLMMQLGALTGDPELSVSPTSINFGEALFGATIGPRNINLSNIGGGTLTVTAADINFVGSSQFSIDSSVFPIVLESAETLPIPVTLVGNIEGPAAATITISCGSQNFEVQLSANVLPDGLVIIGDGTNNNYMPVNVNYGYSYAQMLYMADEILTVNKQIEKVAYHWNGVNDGSNSNQWTIYMGHTNKTAFTGTTDWIALSDLTQVYQGTPNISAENKWIEIELGMPFVYNGTDNLVIAVHEAKPGSNGNSAYFYNTASTTGRSIRCQSDSANPSPASPPSGTLTAAHPNIRMYFGDLPSNPVISVSPVNINFGTIFFNATSDIKYVTVANAGAETLHLNASDVEITGTNEALFSFDNSVFPFALGTGVSAQIPVYLVGTIAGDVTANLEITYDGNTEVVALSANVLPDGTVIVGDGTLTQRQPFAGTWGYERSAAIYTMAEIGGAGMVESIGWNASASNASVYPYKIYLGTTADTQLTYQTFDIIIQDMTLVDEGNHTFDSAGWHTFNLATPFLFAGGNLIVAVETNYGGNGGGGSPNFYYTDATNAHMFWYADNSAPTGNGTPSSNRPNLMLSLSEPTGAPELSVNPDGNYEFPLTFINTTAGKEFTVANIGGGNINVIDITITGDGFALATGFSPVTIGSGGMYSFTIEYSPTAGGDHTATLLIESDAGNHSAELSGSCLDPTITELPHTENFDSVSAPTIPVGWTVLNPDNTGVYWKTSTYSSHSSPNSMFINYTSYGGGPLNDWFITPPVALEAGKEYRVSFYYRAYSASCYENLALYFGSNPTATGMNELLWSHEDFNHVSYALVEETVSPTADDSYFFGWYAFSGENEYGIYVDSIKIEELSPTPVFAVEPISHDFGEVVINATSNKSIKVINTGGGQLGITAIEISGDDVFELGTLPTLPVSLGRDEFINFDVVFAPTAAGTHNATITITDDQSNRYSVDAGSLRSKNTRSRDAHTVALTGSCFDPTIRTFPFFEGFEDGNTQGSTIIAQWEQIIGSGTKQWTANNTETQYNRTPKSGNWNAFLQWSGESTLIRPIMLEANKEYKLKFYARQDNADNTYAKVKASFGTGNTLADLTQPIIAQTGVINGDYQEFSGVFSTETSGLYYIGINGWISGTPWYLSLDDISIDYNYVATPDAPADIDTNTTVTIAGAGFVGALETTVAPENLTPIPNPAFLVANHQVWQLIGTGTVTLTFQNNDTEDIWIAFVVGGAWVAHEIPAGGSVDIMLDLDAKDASLEFTLGKGGNPTLPVELSYFNAVFMVNENSVKLSWKTESETQMLGYQIYRSTEKDLAHAIMITPTIINASNNSTGDSYTYLDREVENGTYYYWLEAVSYNSSEYYGYQTVVIDIPSTPELPNVSSMSNAYPNPFKDMTNVDIAIKGGETGSFTIYNMLGQVVYKQKLSEGNIKIKWNGRDNSGNRCGSGVYFYKLVTPTKSETKKMVIMK